MLVVIDAGNSNVVIGLYQGDTLLTHWRIMTAGYRTADESDPQKIIDLLRAKTGGNS